MSVTFIYNDRDNLVFMGWISSDMSAVFYGVGVCW